MLKKHTNAWAKKKAAVRSSLVAVIPFAVAVIGEAQQAKKILRMGYLSRATPLVNRPKQFGNICVSTVGRLGPHLAGGLCR